MFTHKAYLFAIYRTISFLNSPCCIPYSLIMNSKKYLKARLLGNLGFGSKLNLKPASDLAMNLQNETSNGLGFETESKVFSPLY